MQASQAGSYTTSNRCCDTVAAHSSELLCTDTQSTGPLTPGCHAEGTLPCRLKHTLVVPVAETLTAPASSTTAVPVADPGHSSFLATCPSLSPHKITYFVGVHAILRRLGIINISTKLAGSSGGSVAAAIISSPLLNLPRSWHSGATKYILCCVVHYARDQPAPPSCLTTNPVPANPCWLLFKAYIGLECSHLPLYLT